MGRQSDPPGRYSPPAGTSSYDDGPRTDPRQRTPAGHGRGDVRLADSATSPPILAFLKSWKLVFVTIALFICSFTILATARLGNRAPIAFKQLAGIGAPSFIRPAYLSSGQGVLNKPFSSVSMAPARYQSPPQTPPVFTATPKSLIEDTKRLIARSKQVQDDAANNIAPENATFANSILPMSRDDDKMAIETHIIGFYQAVSTDQALRDASSDAEKLMDDFGIESSLREDVFKLYDAVLKKGEKLDPESARLLDKSHKGYVKNGLGIPAGPQRERFKDIKKKLSEIGIEFQKALNEEKGGLWLTEAELEGVPADVVQNLQKGEGANAGKVFLTFKYPDLFPTLKYALNSQTRKKVFVANENKCNSNVALFKEAILLRDEAARILGYKSHAEFRIEDKMAKTPKTVNDFLGDLRKKLAPGGVNEVQKLLALKQDDLAKRNKSAEFDGHYYLWDHRFYDTLMLEKDFALDQNRIAEYFPLGPTIKGMFKIFEEIFGLVFVEITGEDRAKLSPTGKGDDIVWHKDVQLFSVWDDEGEGSGFVGYLYLDLHPREGKYGHAANFNLQPGYIDENGKRRYPATALVCNFSKPTPKKPSLLKHDEVVTLFHELGHGIHDLVSRTTYSRFHGTSTARDFVEAPSQMLENWCWTPSQLKSLSTHYSTLSPEYKAAWETTAGNCTTQPSAQIPDDLIESIVKTKHVNGALFNLRQLHFGIFDMTVHQPASHAELEKMAFSSLYNQLRNEISKLDGPEVQGSSWDWGNGQATFGHLIGGYDAGYYGYLSSQVYSTDMFYTAFAANPMDGKEGRRYRHTVLERGGSQDEMQTLIDFLGREPSTAAFYKELGI